METPRSIPVNCSLAQHSNIHHKHTRRHVPVWTTAATIALVVVVVVDVVFLVPIVAHVAVFDERLPLAPHKFVASGHFRVATRVVERPCQEEEQNPDQPVLLCSTATLFSLTKANKTEASILSLQTLNVCLDWIEDAITRTVLCLTLDRACL